MTQQHAIGLRPDFSATTSRRNADGLRNNLLRAIVLTARDSTTALTAAENDSSVRDVIRKGAVDFLGTASSAAFNQPSYAANLDAIVGPSAFRAIRAKAVTANFDDNYSSVFISSSIVSPSLIRFVAQGANIPVKQGSFPGVSVAPRKVGVIEVFTRQLIDSSNALPLVRTTLDESIPPAFDSIMLDTNVDDGIRPAGLRNGISAETSGGSTAMIGDLTLLASRVAGVAGNISNLIFIADPATAFKIAIALPQFPFQVVASSGLTAGTVIALAANAVAIGAGSSVRYETDDTTTLHMEDTAPADIGIVGSPANIASAPARSLFQTDCVALRLIFECDFKLRVANSLSWMASVAW